MKTTAKRILSILLALTLGLALFTPMAAALEEATFLLFTKRMPSSTLIDGEKPVTLAPVAQVPAGVDAELQYQWYTLGWGESDGYWMPVEGATGPTDRKSVV